MLAVNWKVFLASATGKQHLDADAPCQDSGYWGVVDGLLVGVVCDGAGSASQGHEGAQFLARWLGEALAVLPASWPAGGSAAELRELLLPVIESTRADLASIARARELTLRDFACTLVGCLATAAGGCFFHVGDGFAIHMAASGASLLSLPENGEYADETYFVSDESWKDHLRVTPLGPVRPGDCIGLMTDGAAPFAVNRQRTGFFRPFIDPVASYLAAAGAADGNLALHGVLADSKTHAITGDDKTLLLALAG